MIKVLVLAALLAPLFSFSQDFQQFENHVFQTPSDTLLYRLLTPSETDANNLYPLVIFLHGMGERGNDNILSLKHIAPLFLDEKNRNQFPCYVIVPQCPPNERWTYPNWYLEPQEPIRTVVELIDSLSALPYVDNSRIYLTGLSMGGYGTWYLISKFPEKFAAAVPICGGGDLNQVDKIVHMPLWVFHGSKDTVVSPEQSRSMVRALKKAGGKPRYTEYKRTGHDSWTKAYLNPQLLPWLFSQRVIK